MTNDLFMHCQGVDLISHLMEPVPFNAFFFFIKKGYIVSYRRGNSNRVSRLTHQASLLFVVNARKVITHYIAASSVHLLAGVLRWEQYRSYSSTRVSD